MCHSLFWCSFDPPDRNGVLFNLLLTSAGGLPPTVFTLPASDMMSGGLQSDRGAEAPLF